MKFRKILTLSIFSFVVAQSAALAGSFKFSSPYPELIFCSGGITNPQFILKAQTFSTDYPLLVCLRSKDSKTLTPLFRLDKYFADKDKKYIRESILHSEQNPQNSITLILSTSETKCIPGNHCLLSAYQINEFDFTIIKAYFNDIEFARNPIKTPTELELCFEEFYSAYLQDHPKQYFDAVIQSTEHCNAQSQKDEL